MGMLGFARFGVAALVIVSSAVAHAKTACEAALDDEFLWLERSESSRVRAWIDMENARTERELRARPEYAALYSAARTLPTTHAAHFPDLEGGYYWSFMGGGLQRMPAAAFVTDPEGEWETVLTLDEIKRSEGEDSTYEGDAPLVAGSSRHLVFISRGGRDARAIREYDVNERRFVPDGFNLPESFAHVAALSEDELFVAMDGVVRRWRRGRPFAEAEVVYTSRPGDMDVAPAVIRHGEQTYPLIHRLISFDRTEIFLVAADGLRRLPIPETAELIDVRDRQLILALKQDLPTRDGIAPAGAIVDLSIDGDGVSDVGVLFAPAANQAIRAVSVGRGRVVVSLIEDVRGEVIEITRGPDGRPRRRQMRLPKDGVFVYTVDDDGFDTVDVARFLEPRVLYRVERGTDRLTPLTRSPERFDARGARVEQNFAVSADGTRVPYFVITPRGYWPNKQNPTLLYGYGGFEDLRLPEYSFVPGKLWVERGGVYVVANIRGGAEYGPRWHQAARRENRQRAFDDFIAVAEDLIARGITSPRHLGVHGVSNGGLLAGAVMVQRPELFNAALIQMPLLDMLRYARLSQGFRWVDEYGDPDDPADWAFLSAYSPYQNVRADARYPRPFLTTSSTDDRVHPGHARKMAARLKRLGHDVLFHENADGGHGSGDVDATDRARAREYTYLWSRLK